MSNSFRKFARDYLVFSAKDRRGLLILFSVVAVFMITMRLLPVKQTAVSKDAFQQELAQLKISVDTASKSYYKNYQSDDEAFNDYAQPDYHHTSYTKGELFAFDPNTLDAEGWRRLGVKDKTIQTIQNFVSKGYKFRKPEDIARIYGLRSDVVQRLLPYVHIADQTSSNVNTSYTATPFGTNEVPATAERKTRIVEINSADTAALISLPGIGSKLAARIITFRQKLGGFTSVNQLGETYGLPDSTFQMLKARFSCNNTAVNKININTAEVNDLKTHPYIKWNIANAIVNYRMQHGVYKSVDDLRKIDLITDDLF